MTSSDRRTIPFDYAFRFELSGEMDRQHRQTVRVSIESHFVAVAIGYGVIPRRDPLRFGPSVVEDLDLDQTTLARIQAGMGGTATTGDALKQPVNRIALNAVQMRARPGAAAAGVTPTALWPPAMNDFRVSWLTNALRRAVRSQSVSSLARSTGHQGAADVIEVLKRGVRFTPQAAASIEARGTDAPLDMTEMETLLEEIPPDAARFQFLYRLNDEGSGREFQSDYILSTAGLGIADGERPFRQFAVPIVFDPMATIRMDVIEKSSEPCELHVALHGYRMLGERGTPTDMRRTR